jgi:hypothetical protein
MSDDQEKKPAEPIVYYFEPANPGESLVSYSVPARDLTQKDWDRLDPAAQFQALAKGPTGEAMYRKGSRDERADEKRRVEAAAKAAEIAERRAAEEAAKRQAGGGE